MKTIIAFLAVAALAPLAAQVPVGEDAAAAAIEAVIERAYIGGIWTRGDEEAARAGFDASFVMQVAREDGVQSTSLDAWLERLGLDGEPLRENVTHEIEVLDVTGRAAVARVELHADGKPLYTDYMSLYRFSDGWRIVAKTFHAHK